MLRRFFGSVPQSLFQLGRLNHVAIATSQIEPATAFYRNILGAKVSHPVPLPEHGVTTVFVDLGNTKLELLEPLGETSPIAAFLKRSPSGGLHHICIEVDDITKAISQVKSNNVRTLSSTSQIGAHDKPVIFLHPKDCGGVLVELEQA